MQGMSTALHLAAAAGHAEAVTLLISAGAALNMLDSVTKPSKTNSSHAHAIVSLIIYPDQVGSTALRRATINHHKEVTDILTKAAKRPQPASHQQKLLGALRFHNP